MEPAQIREIAERTAKALGLRPAVGRGTAVTRVRLSGGLECEIEDGAWKLKADLGAKHGGAGAGPDPGVLGRAALGSCLAIGYAMWAARRNVPLERLEVTVEADYDARAQYGVDAVEPGYREVRYTVSVTSPAPAEEVMRVLDEADACSPYLAVFARPQTVRREVRIHAG